MRVLTRLIGTVLSLSLALVTPVRAQVQTAAPASPAPVSTANTFSQQELDQLVAPIALYPDPLLAQISMASTCPLDIAPSLSRRRTPLS